MESQSSIRSLFHSSKAQRRALESIPEPNGAVYQEKLRSAISTLEECRGLVDRSSLFSTNESEDDISSSDLQYLLVDYYLAELILKDNSSDRKNILKSVQNALERYLSLLDAYRMLSRPDRKLYERYLDDRNKFSLQSSVDPTSRRETKIARFKQETLLKSKLEHLSHNPSALQNDDAVLRDLNLTEINFNTHKTFHTLDMIAQELTILSFTPPPPLHNTPTATPDSRQQNSQGRDSYSDRLDPAISLRRGNAGPILSKDGKPLKPFTLLDNRQRLREGVFRPSHNLPTMTIDEYLAEEKRRGGIIEGGGEQSGNPAEPDEDNYHKADMETMKAREWDEFKEDNPKGSGNTLNRG